jgi:hypothetical protein
VAVPVGSTVQALAERFALSLGQHDLERRTAVWLALPRAVHIAGVLDPFAYDPEAEGEPHRLLAHAPARWSLVVAWAHGTASSRLRLLLLVPTSQRARAEEVLVRLRRRLMAA